MAQCHTKSNTHLLIKFALLTWGVYDADTQRIQCSKKQNKIKLIANQFRRSKDIDCLGGICVALTQPYWAALGAQKIRSLLIFSVTSVTFDHCTECE
jgi:hypothetical protein